MTDSEILRINIFCINFLVILIGVWYFIYNLTIIKLNIKMNKLFKLASPSTFGNKEGVLYPLFEDLDGQRSHYIQRKKEIEELMTLL